MIKTFTIFLFFYVLARFAVALVRAWKRNRPDIEDFCRRQRNDFFHEEEKEGDIKINKVPSNEGAAARYHGEYVDYKQVKKTT